MTTLATVKLWGREIGVVALEEGQATASFEYDAAFVQSNIQLSPFVMPLSKQVYRFPGLAADTFHGLPGLLADALPDKFGNDVINAWLATQGRSPETFNAVERLCYTGSRAMGALEFTPATGPKPKKGTPIQIDALVDLASEVLSKRHDLQASFRDEDREQALKQILKVGTSAGGARPKAIIAWNEQTNEVRSGQVPADEGFSHWILKFDGVKEQDLSDPKGFGAIEYAYYQMAQASGITMSPCRLFEENDRRHFMTKRFDRLDNGDKLHMQSLCAIRHYDFNLPDAYSYEQAFMTIHDLNLPMEAIEEQFRRMTFNIIARNQDDHVKNIAFLMDKRGQWSLSPAFDMSYSYNPTGPYTSRHQMSMNNKRDGFTRDDFRACEKVAVLKRGRSDDIFGEVLAAVSRWKEFASAAGVSDEHQAEVQRCLRLDIPSK